MGLLRIWLAFAVLRFHATAWGGGWMPAGEAAVQAFFVLSGFSMALVLEEDYGDERRRFWVKRAIRLWPPYLAALGLVLAYELWLWSAHGVGAGVVQEWMHGARPGAPALAGALFGNLTLLGLDLLAMLGLRADGSLCAVADPQSARALSGYLAIPQAWSLSVELVFYALAPWYVRLRTRTLLALGALSLLLRAGLLGAGFSHDSWALRLAPVELGTFAFGILAWRAYKGGRLQGLRTPWASALGWALILASPLLSRHPAAQALSLSLATALALPWVFGVSRRLAWDRRIGEWAYPLYLLHHAVSYAGKDLAFRWGLKPRFWALALACLALSALFWWALQRPIRWLERALGVARPLRKA